MKAAAFKWDQQERSRARGWRAPSTAPQQHCSCAHRGQGSTAVCPKKVTKKKEKNKKRRILAFGSTQVTLVSTLKFNLE